MTQKSWRFGDEELMYVKEVLDSGLGASTYGTMNARLEEAFARRFGVRYAITHNSGTSTLHSCLAAAGVGPGDEVISPALTVISNAAVTLHQNAVPVFADVDPDTAEAIQPQLMQFKGNIGDLAEAQRQADALRKTIEFFE